MPESAPPSAPSLVSVLALRKHYAGANRPALDGVSLDLRQGDFLGLLGPNGAGKTTLISILCRLLDADSGRILFQGRELGSEDSDFRHHFGLVPQDIALYPTLTCLENLRFFGRMCGLPARNLDRTVLDLLDRLGLAASAHQQIRTFSGGMKRRCNLAAALLHQPRLLILDEPTTGVDPQSRLLIYDCLRALNRAGTTILYTTHYLKEAEELCGSAFILDEGRIVAQGSPSGLIASCPGASSLDDVFFHLTGHALRD